MEDKPCLFPAPQILRAAQTDLTVRQPRAGCRNWRWLCCVVCLAVCSQRRDANRRCRSKGAEGSRPPAFSHLGWKVAAGMLWANKSGRYGSFGFGPAFKKGAGTQPTAVPKRCPDSGLTRRQTRALTRWRCQTGRPAQARCRTETLYQDQNPEGSSSNQSDAETPRRADGLVFRQWQRVTAHWRKRAAAFSSTLAEAFMGNAQTRSSKFCAAEPDTIGTVARNQTGIAGFRSQLSQGGLRIPKPRTG